MLRPVLLCSGRREHLRFAELARVPLTVSAWGVIDRNVNHLYSALSIGGHVKLACSTSIAAASIATIAARNVKHLVSPQMDPHGRVWRRGSTVARREMSGHPSSLASTRCPESVVRCGGDGCAPEASRNTRGVCGHSTSVGRGGLSVLSNLNSSCAPSTRVVSRLGARAMRDGKGVRRAAPPRARWSCGHSGARCYNGLHSCLAHKHDKSQRNSVEQGRGWGHARGLATLNQAEARIGPCRSFATS